MTRIMSHCLHALVLAISIYCWSGMVFADINDSAVKIKWSYKGNTGPERWGQLAPAFALCASGKLQSPINLPKRVPDAPSALAIHYQSAPLEIVNDGTTEVLLGKTQTIIKDGHSVQVNFNGNQPTEYITFANKDYSLLQFHIHSPSENQWRSMTYALEIHFVHQGENGQLMVIGVFVQHGKANKVLQKMIEHLPSVMSKEENIQGVSINPAELLPEKQSYFSFMGSLTTPPCTEGVQWLVMSNTITASPAQILLLRKASGGGNARPVQSLNKRKIFYSAGK